MPLNLTTLHMIRLGFMHWKFNMIKLKYKVMQHALKVFKTREEQGMELWKELRHCNYHMLTNHKSVFFRPL